MSPVRQLDHPLTASVVFFQVTWDRISVEYYYWLIIIIKHELNKNPPIQGVDIHNLGTTVDVRKFADLFVRY